MRCQELWDCFFNSSADDEFDYDRLRNDLMDDVGGIHGYIDFLRTIHGNDPDEREDMKSWGRWMGWTGRMNKPETLL